MTEGNQQQKAYKTLENETDFPGLERFCATPDNEKSVAAGVVEAMIFPWEMTYRGWIRVRIAS